MNQSDLNAIENAAVLQMTPDELERYAQAEEDAKQAERAQARLIEIAAGRSALSGYQDLCDPWPEALIAGLSEFFDERGIAAIRAFYPEESREFRQLQVRELNAMDLQLEIRKAVASRTQHLTAAPQKPKQLTERKQTNE